MAYRWNIARIVFSSREEFPNLEISKIKDDILAAYRQYTATCILAEKSTYAGLFLESESLAILS